MIPIEEKVVGSGIPSTHHCTAFQDVVAPRGRSLHRIFYTYAKHRSKENHIYRLQANGVEATTVVDMDSLAHDHFVRLIGTPRPRPHCLELMGLDLLPGQLESLEESFTKEHIWAAIKDLHPDKAPGPDGFTILFFQCCWSIIKVEVIKAIHAFSDGDGRGIEFLNEAFIALIPKHGAPVELKDFHLSA